MLTTEQSILGSGKLPRDLREWLGERELVNLALEAVQTINWRLPEITSNNPAVRPQLMLTLLSYCYAASICGSQDIEWAARSDKMVRYICAGDQPDWLAIRRFRRQNVGLLRGCLAYIFNKAWTSQKTIRPLSGSPAGRSGSEADCAVVCAVRNRIDTAIFLDSAADDF